MTLSILVLEEVEKMQLEGLNAVVTGGGRGIGREIALELAEAGASVAVADVNLASAKETVKSIEEMGGSASAICVDISDSGQVRDMVAAASEALGSLDILVNNAGIGISASVMDTTDEELDRVLGVNLKGTFLCCREASKVMVERGKGGRIVNIASSAGDNARVEGGAYCASKAGILQLTRVLAMELGPFGINVNAVSPGLTDTVTGTNVSANDTYRNSFLAQVSLGRAAHPRDVARAVRFLASPESAYITGETIHVDGGYSAGKPTVRR